MDWITILENISLFGKLYEKVIELALSLLQSELSLLLGVESELDKLKKTAGRIHALLRDAEELCHIEDDNVKHWLRDLRDVALDADDLLDEVQARLNASRL